MQGRLQNPPGWGLPIRPTHPPSCRLYWNDRHLGNPSLAKCGWQEFEKSCSNRIHLRFDCDLIVPEKDLRPKVSESTSIPCPALVISSLPLSVECFKIEPGLPLRELVPR